MGFYFQHRVHERPYHFSSKYSKQMHATQTLESMLCLRYGTTANCNTYPVAFRILFGNEDKEGWMDFWDFANLVHPSIDDTRVTIITDQAKGLTQSIADVLSLTRNFHCSYHRHQNILKFVRGGTQKYSCLWLYTRLMKAKTICEIEQIKHKHAPFVNDKALKYLNAVDEIPQCS